MHETVLASSILRMALEAAGRHEAPGQKLRVEEIGLDVGVMACVEEQTLRGCFELLAEGTAAETARLKINKRPMSGICPDCGAHVETTRRDFSCPACAGLAVDWRGGNEMEISSITVVPCITGGENRHES